MQRDHTIAKQVDRVVAFGYLVRDHSLDTHDKTFVHGGTGWTVRLAQRFGKPIYLYELHDRRWLSYDYTSKRYVACDEPVLQGRCAVVGDRQLVTYDTGYTALSMLFKAYESEFLF